MWPTGSRDITTGLCPALGHLVSKDLLRASQMMLTSCAWHGMSLQRERCNAAEQTQDKKRTQTGTSSHGFYPWWARSAKSAGLVSIHCINQDSPKAMLCIGNTFLLVAHCPDHSYNSCLLHSSFPPLCCCFGYLQPWELTDGAKDAKEQWLATWHLSVCFSCKKRRGSLKGRLKWKGKIKQERKGRRDAGFLVRQGVGIWQIICSTSDFLKQL